MPGLSERPLLASDFQYFRQKPLRELFPKAKEQGVGILVRLPLASGLLTGKFTSDTKFEKEDHRSFNENGEQFNVGETFAGLGFTKGVELSNKLRWIAENRGNMARAALRWILDNEDFSCVIPGFKTVKQVEDNLQAMDVPSFDENEQKKLAGFYQQEVLQWIRGAY